jgi:hypothetical protein
LSKLALDFIPLLPMPIRGGGGGLKDLIKQASKRLDTTTANAYIRRRNYKKDKDEEEEDSRT